MKKHKIILIIAGLSILISILFIKTISKKINYNILKYSKVEAKRFATIIINTSINEVIKTNEYSKDMIHINKNNNNEIEDINFNTKKVNLLLKNIVEKIEDRLLLVEEGNVDFIDISSSLKGNNFKKVKRGIVCEVPSGSITGNSLLANTGPVIPVKLNFIGSVEANVKVNIKTYGINSSYIELDVMATVTEKISLPKLTEDVKINKTIPIVMKVIQGKIPEYYNFDNNSGNIGSYSLPVFK